MHQFALCNPKYGRKLYFAQFNTIALKFVSLSSLKVVHNYDEKFMK
jgi:hypothetical protein